MLDLLDGGPASSAGVAAGSAGKVHLRVAGYYSWSLPYSGEKGELGTAFTFAVDGMCGFPGCPLPERHPGPHQIAVVDSKRKRQPKPQFGS